MKEKLTRNIGLKILSIILAAILWLVITNVDDPVTAVNFPNIPVQILNADEIRALNQVYSITEGATVDFTAAARRSVADNLNRDDFRITADLSKLSDLNTVTINIKYLGPPTDGVTITNGLNQVMKVELEDLVEKHFRVNVEQTGDVSEGCYVYEKTASTILKISGPKSKIDKIAEAVVDVDVTGYTKSFSTSEQPRVLDSDGKEIDASNLTFSRTMIPVNVGIYNTKKINLRITPTGTPADGLIAANIDYEPQSIEIAAPDDILNNINELSLTEDVNGATKDIEKEINLQEQLKGGIILVGDNQTAVVNISIAKPQAKDLIIYPPDIQVRNIPVGMRLDYLSSGPITISLSGPKKEIVKLTKEDINPYIDLSNYTEGSYNVLVKADVSSFTTVTNTPIVNLRLSRQ